MNAITNNFNLPQPLVEAVRNDGYSNSGTMSVTTLIRPPQMVALEREHGGELSEDASDRIWSLMGQAVHSILERAGQSLTDHIIEQRFYADMRGVRVSGQCDVIHDGTVSDYKITSAWAVKDARDGGKAEWRLQLSMLAVLARLNGLTVDKGEIVAIVRDWSKHRAAEDARDAERFRRPTSYPQSNVDVVPIDLMSHEETLAWMENRIGEHLAAQNGGGPLCTDGERWCQPGAWALYKGKNKRASKVEPTKADLFAWARQNGLADPNSDMDDMDAPDSLLFAKDVRIEERPTVYRRCEEYCPVASICPQFQGGAA